MKRGAVLLVPLLPVVALLASVWLPFVNTARLWFGVPSLFVWISVWVMLIPPALAVVEWGRGDGNGGEGR
ncbi:hypothetical protein SAMN04487905_105207 [Actinopolyspora xinjiangensis]|uniref:DUF3311 domain-containing protein n=1 Tax=Actinopolyspora xinjiangensis TaxID=405564 RepID=A0A1H0TPR7_9ACTN|nr:hypothetical protein [Actinopolyspora xinjiangensis]SDP55999.1 hypothetical protein SAMN04487905_105207 [Actinopolyspora xinjiangensis]